MQDLLQVIRDVRTDLKCEYVSELVREEFLQQQKFWTQKKFCKNLGREESVFWSYIISSSFTPNSARSHAHGARWAGSMQPRNLLEPYRIQPLVQILPTF